MHPLARTSAIRRPLARGISRVLTRPFALAAALVAGGACADSPPTAPGAAPAAAASLVEGTGVWADVRTGETGPGALYELRVPHGWNGDVVYYAHGIRDVLEPVALRDQDASFALLDRLGAMGYAVALSSFSENGYALKDGAQRTHQLRGLFTSAFGAPRRSFLAGHSLGGLVALSLAERFPGQYDGALPMCGVLGGTQRQVDYITNIRALFDVFYPGVLAGTAGEIPAGYNLTAADQDRIVRAVLTNPAGLAVIASTAQTPLEFSYGPNMQVEMLTSLIYALRYHARGGDNVLALVNGKLPFDNTTTTYGPRALPFALVPAAQLAGAHAFVNAAVGRWEGDPSAEQYMARHYTPMGSLAMPVVTLHNRWDPLVPFSHEGAFAATVAATGRAAMLEQRTVDRYGHCAFTADEMAGAFEALIARADAAAAAR